MLSKEEIIFNAMQRYWETKDGANDTRFQSVEELKKYMDNPDMKLFLEVMEEYANQDKWISVAYLPKEMDNWKFLVSNKDDQWTDAASFENGKWNNGECEIIPTHWQPLPNPPKQ